MTLYDAFECYLINEYVKVMKIVMFCVVRPSEWNHLAMNIAWLWLWLWTLFLIYSCELSWFGIGSEGVGPSGKYISICRIWLMLNGVVYSAMCFCVK